MNTPIVHNTHWLQWDGSTVDIDGLAYRIHCALRTVRYPSPRQYVEVWAEMVDRSHPHYVQTRAMLRDHWGLSLLQLHTEEDLLRMCKVEAQLMASQPLAVL